VGSVESFTITTTAGYPTATTLTKTGPLPSGVSFTDNGDGTATLAGTPAAGTAGSYPLTVTAGNSAGSTQQAFTLTVVRANTSPVITSADHATFAFGSAGSFTVTTTAGYPAATTITKTGTLPGGVTFTDNGDGTATIAGTPTAAGAFPITITASNGAANDATQSFTLTVTKKPTITSADRTTFVVGSAGSFTITTTAGYPAATTMTKTGALPGGVSFTDNGDGTATLAGTPAAGTAGSYPLTVDATNAAGTSSQTFTLTVTPASASPVITSADHATFTKGSAGSFTVTTTAGYPAATTITKTGTLPAGVTFTDNGDGTATVAGTSTVAGAYTITVRASNGASTDATQSFTLTVNAPPTITSANTARFTSNVAGQTFTVTTTAGFPTATTLTETGALPAGMTFNDNHNGTATIAGTASVSASTNYPIVIKASNGISPDASQNFTLTVYKATQTIAFAPLADHLYGSAPFTITASASSHLAVTFTSSTMSVCTVSGTTVTVKAAGACTITAAQGGNATYLAADPVARTFTVGYVVSNLAPPNKSTFQAGSTIPVKFQLTGANGKPIPNTVATTLGCTVNVTFNAGTPICATYNTTSQLFQANIATKASLPHKTSYKIVITVKVGTTTVATATTTVTTK
jgi:hypothetical protein